MIHLTFASFAKLIKKSLKRTDKDTVSLLFTINNKSLHNISDFDDKDIIFIDKSDVSKLMHNLINVRNPYRELPKIKQIPNYIANFKKQVVDNLRIDNANSLTNELAELIRKDRRISEKQKKELLNKSTSSLEEFLAYTYLEVLQIPNKLPSFFNMKLSEIISFEFPFRKIGSSYYYSIIIDENFTIDEFSYKKHITKTSIINNERLLTNASKRVKDIVQREFINNYNHVFNIPVIVGNTTYSNDPYLYLAGITSYTFEEDTMDFKYEIITPIERSIFLDEKHEYYNSDLATQIGIIDRAGGYGKYHNYGTPVFELNTSQWNVKKIDLVQKLKNFGF